MDLRAQSAFLAALVAAVLAVAVALRATQRRQALLFALLAGNLALFHLADFLAAAAGRALFTRLMLVAGAALPATGHRFFQAFLEGHAVTSEPVAGVRVQSKRLSQILLGGAAAGLVLALTPLVHQPVVLGAVVAYVIGAFALVFHHVFQRRDTTRSRIERMRLTYVAVGGIIALGFAVLGFVPGLSGLFAALGNLGIILYLYFLSQAILRHRLLDLNELLGKIVVLTGIALLLTVVYGVILAAVGDRPPLLLFNLLLASAIFLTLFPPLRSQAERRVMAWLFAERYELTQALERLRRELPGLIDPGACAVRILDRLYDTNRVTHASMYLLAEDGTGFTLLASRGPEPPTWLDAAALREVMEAAASGQKAVLRETVERRLQESRVALEAKGAEAGLTPPPTGTPGDSPQLERLETALERMHAGVTVPLLSGTRVVGLLNLQDERVYEAYSTEEIAAIILVAEVAATVVENSRLYQQMKERDRLAALGEMSAGLAHEIRNPLGAIKAAAQYLEPEALPGDQGEFLDVIIEETDRLNGVVSQFLDYARPLKTAFVMSDVGEVVKKTVRLLERRDIPEGVKVVLDLAGDLPPVDADPEQIKQVLINLALNAVQAMEGKGTLTLRTTRAAGPDESDGGGPGATRVEIRVRDTGPGIPESVRDNLFIPFFTTKDRGTGLGLPICQRIVRGHGGTLEVHSRPGRGAEFVVRLPARPAASREEGAGKKAAGGGTVVPFRRRG